jgi:methanogenic corrinoid protein MtbC1
MVNAVSQLKFDRSEGQQADRWDAGAVANGKMTTLNVGPRLVGGTTFGRNDGIDKAQVVLLADASLQSLEETRKVIVGWQRQGLSLTQIYIAGIAESAKVLGEHWLSDRLSFAECTIGFSRLHQMLHDYSAEFVTEGRLEPNGYSLLLMTEPGTQHGLGVFMLSEFFKRAGWNVTLVNPMDMTDFKRNFQSDWFDAVGLSLSTERHLKEIQSVLPEMISGCANPSVQVFLGGAVSSYAPEKLTWPDTYLIEGNALQAIEVVTQTLFNMERQINLTP